MGLLHHLLLSASIVALPAYKVRHTPDARLSPVLSASGSMLQRHVRSNGSQASVYTQSQHRVPGEVQEFHQKADAGLVFHAPKLLHALGESRVKAGITSLFPFSIFVMVVIGLCWWLISVVTTCKASKALPLGSFSLATANSDEKLAFLHWWCSQYSSRQRQSVPTQPIISKDDPGILDTQTLSDASEAPSSDDDSSFGEAPTPTYEHQLSEVTEEYLEKALNDYLAANMADGKLKPYTRDADKSGVSGWVSLWEADGKLKPYTRDADNSGTTSSPTPSETSSRALSDFEELDDESLMNTVTAPLLVEALLLPPEA